MHELKVGALFPVKKCIAAVEVRNGSEEGSRESREGVPKSTIGGEGSQDKNQDTRCAIQP